jgi:hypothetical protein
MVTSCRRGILAVVVVLAPLVTAAGCGGGCGDVNCGSGIVVWWAPEDVPEAASYLLCVDGDCEFVEPVPMGAGDDPRVAPGVNRSKHDVDVELELRDHEGSQVAVFRGTGSKSGRCCPGVAFRATADGELVVDSV